MAFTQRLSAPSKSNKYYFSNNVFYKSGYGMPNCTCYAWGRFYEISGTYPKLSTSNAENWYGKTSDGYKRSKTPQVGAVICWRRGKAGVGSDGAGHVAIVEKVYSNGDILTSNSAWRSTFFYTQKLKKSNNYSIGSAYTFQGFILNPAVKSSTSTTNKTTSTSTTKKQAVKFKCAVINVKTKLNIRSGPSTSHKVVGGLGNGTICNIVQTTSNGKWGKLSSGKGWISLTYTTKVLSTRKVTADSGLNIRSGPGTSYKKTGLLKDGTTCYIIKYTSDKKWGKLSSGKGWISLAYTKTV